MSLNPNARSSRLRQAALPLGVVGLIGAFFVARELYRRVKEESDELDSVDLSNPAMNPWKATGGLPNETLVVSGTLYRLPPGDKSPELLSEEARAEMEPVDAGGAWLSLWGNEEELLVALPIEVATAPVVEGQSIIWKERAAEDGIWRLRLDIPVKRDFRIFSLALDLFCKDATERQAALRGTGSGLPPGVPRHGEEDDEDDYDAVASQVALNRSGTRRR